MKLKVIITAGEDSGFVAQVSALRGCWSQGATREEALANAREAIAAWLETVPDTAKRAKKASRGLSHNSLNFLVANSPTPELFDRPSQSPPFDLKQD